LALPNDFSLHLKPSSLITMVTLLNVSDNFEKVQEFTRDGAFDPAVCLPQGHSIAIGEAL
jgi:hypothetical protein